MEEVKCYIPKTLDEALEIRSQHDVIVLAGGSDLMVSHKRTLGLTPVFEKPVNMFTGGTRKPGGQGS